MPGSARGASPAWIVLLGVVFSLSPHRRCVAATSARELLQRAESDAVNRRVERLIAAYERVIKPLVWLDELHEGGQLDFDTVVDRFDLDRTPAMGRILARLAELGLGRDQVIAALHLHRIGQPIVVDQLPRKGTAAWEAMVTRHGSVEVSGQVGRVPRWLERPIRYLRDYGWFHDGSPAVHHLEPLLIDGALYPGEGKRLAVVWHSHGHRYLLEATAQAGVQLATIFTNISDADWVLQTRPFEPAHRQLLAEALAEAAHGNNAEVVEALKGHWGIESFLQDRPHIVRGAAGEADAIAVNDGIYHTRVSANAMTGDTEVVVQLGYRPDRYVADLWGAYALPGTARQTSQGLVLSDAPPDRPSKKYQEVIDTAVRFQRSLTAAAIGDPELSAILRDNPYLAGAVAVQGSPSAGQDAERAAWRVADSLRVPTWDLADYQRFWSGLKQRDMVTPYYKGPAGVVRNKQFAPPVEVSADIALGLHDGLSTAWKYLRERLNTAEAIEKHFDDNAFTFGGRQLRNPAADLAYLRLLELGWNLPLAYDVLVTKRGIKLLEVQTGYGYAGMAAAVFAAARIDPEAAGSYVGRVSPQQAVRLLRSLGQGEPIHVLDVKTGFDADQFALARGLGDESSVPLSLFDIEDRTKQGWRFRLRERRGASWQPGDRLVTVRHALSRCVQSDLDALEKMFRDHGQQHKIQLVREFFEDSAVNWAIHPFAPEFLSKKNLLDFMAFAEATGAPILDHFSQHYAAGQVVPPGQYALKPVDGNSGLGIEMIEVAEGYAVRPGVKVTRLAMGDNRVFGPGESLKQPGEYRVEYVSTAAVLKEQRVSRLIISSAQQPYRVPSGQIVQERFDPAVVPVLTSMPGALGWVPTRLAGSVELRIMAPVPMQPLAANVYARIVPRYNEQGVTMTNLGAGMEAFDWLVAKRLRTLSPADRQLVFVGSAFGFGPARIGGGGHVGGRRR